MLTDPLVLSGMATLVSVLDPLFLQGLAYLSAMLAIGAVGSWLLAMLNEHLERRTPRYRLPLQAAYASFHQFLRSVRLAALRSRI
jgi:hypothetical protein